MRALWIAALLGTLVACNDSSSSDAGAACKVATDCPEVDCPCSNGTTVSSYCLCQGGISSNGSCGPGAVCAQSSDCDQVCSDVDGPGGSGGGTTGGSTGGGGNVCVSSNECGTMPCCSDGGAAQTYCLQGVCTCPLC